MVAPLGLRELVDYSPSERRGERLRRQRRSTGSYEPEVSLESTKWKRIFANLSAAQGRERNGNPVLRFVKAAGTPVRFVGQSLAYDGFRENVNLALAFHGFELRDNGRIYPVAAARTLSEAQKRARSLSTKLSDRDVHPEVLAFFGQEYLQENYFHAVFETTKSVADRLRSMTGLSGDGAALVDEACTLKNNMPPLAFNLLNNETEENEHKGFAMLMKGMFSAFRNTTAHTPKIKWPITEDDALDMMTLASMIHRRLDKAHVTPAAPIKRI
jgi:uncharacterized protein (TIGR02391 family)